MKICLIISLFIFIHFHARGDTCRNLSFHDTPILSCPNLSPASSVRITASSSVREIMRFFSEVDYSMNERSRENWKTSVIPRTKKMICAALELAPPNTELVVLGYGKGYDIPDEIFTDPRFTKIHLVDHASSIVKSALLEKGIHSDRVTIHGEDISLYTDEFYQALDEIIDSARGDKWLEEAALSLDTLFKDHLYKGKPVRIFRDDFPFLEKSRAGMVVSSMTMTQIKKESRMASPVISLMKNPLISRQVIPNCLKPWFTPFHSLNSGWRITI